MCREMKPNPCLRLQYSFVSICVSVFVYVFYLPVEYSIISLSFLTHKLMSVYLSLQGLV